MLGSFPTTEQAAQRTGADLNRTSGLLGSIGFPDVADVPDLLRAGVKGLLAMTLFHGTPHKFDRFALDAIGTGEGAQAFGHGLYFAENPSVGDSYRSALTGNRFEIKIDGELLPDNAQTKMNRGLYEKLADGESLDSVEQAYKERIALAPDEPFFRERLAELERVKEQTKGKTVTAAPNEGHLYEVEIPDEITDRMLDWDAPLSEQPESVRQALQRLSPPPRKVEDLSRDELIGMLERIDRNGTYSDAASIAEGWEPATMDELLQSAENVGLQDYLNDLPGQWTGNETGQSLYYWLTTNQGGTTGGSLHSNAAQQAASKALNEAGIPGIRYFDNQSRAAGEGTRNIVVFDPDDITQVKRDGELVWENASGIKPNKVEEVASDLGEATGLL